MSKWIAFLICSFSIILPWRLRVLFTAVLGRITQFIYLTYYGILNYILSEIKKYKDQKKVLNAKKFEEIIFTKNTMEGVNILPRGLSFARGDVILTTNLENNSNLLPWQMLVNEKGVIHKRCEISPEDECFDIIFFYFHIKFFRLRFIHFNTTCHYIVYENITLI